MKLKASDKQRCAGTQKATQICRILERTAEFIYVPSGYRGNPFLSTCGRILRSPSCEEKNMKMSPSASHVLMKCIDMHII